MNSLTSNRRSLLIVALVTISVFFLTRCVGGPDTKTGNPTASTITEFAGSAACANCHKDVYEKHLHTEHHLTSRPASADAILGSFQPGKNVFAFDPFVNVTMEKRDSGWYQVEYDNGSEVRKGRFDIVVGSGRKGQSYLNWINSRLVQLPITFFTPASQWSNSPGYYPHKVAFYRPITSRCLECHSTYFQKISDSGQRLEEFDRRNIVYGVECERCHGPAAGHVAFQTAHPELKTAKYIVNPGKLSRDRLLDLCTLCHGGALSKTKPSFSFRAGDTLSNYFAMQGPMQDADNIDVHGNQMGLLSLSKCFNSSDLTCISCHSVHENEAGKLEAFSRRCVSCHQADHGKTCPMTRTLGPSIAQNCVDCHMPRQPSHAIAVYLQGDDVPTPALLRTHYIKVYPDETKKFLEQLKKKNPSAPKQSSK